MTILFSLRGAASLSDGGEATGTCVSRNGRAIGACAGADRMRMARCTDGLKQKETERRKSSVTNAPKTHVKREELGWQRQIREQREESPQKRARE